ncbi:MAG: amidohydrolase family protein, partial [Pseudomonadota bacterium]
MLRRTLFLSIALAIIVPAAAADTPERTLIRAGTLLAVPGSPPVEDRLIVVDGGVITDIVPLAQEAEYAGRGAAQARVIDLSDQFVMPGFIDLHVHLSGEAGPGRKLATVTDSDAHVALTAAMHARETLLAG